MQSVYRPLIQTCVKSMNLNFFKTHGVASHHSLIGQHFDINLLQDRPLRPSKEKCVSKKVTKNVWVVGIILAYYSTLLANPILFYTCPYFTSLCKFSYLTLLYYIATPKSSFTWWIKQVNCYATSSVLHRMITLQWVSGAIQCITHVTHVYPPQLAAQQIVCFTSTTVDYFTFLPIVLRTLLSKIASPYAQRT